MKSEHTPERNPEESTGSEGSSSPESEFCSIGKPGGAESLDGGGSRWDSQSPGVEA